jgi:hypothetical protein
MLLLAASGCASSPSAPPPPLMSPYPAGGYDYGYAEERLTADLWRVVYHGRWRALDLDPVVRGGQLDRAAGEAADLALWRAAQLALATGKPAFSVVDRRTDTETLRRPGAFVDDPWPYYSSYPYGRGSLWPRPWPATYYVPGDAQGRARATLVVRFESRVTAATIDAAATVRRIEPIYGPRPPPAKP